MINQKINQLIPSIIQQCKQQFYDKNQNKLQINSQNQLNIQQQNNIIIKHAGYKCDNCLVEPILNIRYQCSKCKSYNLCSNCQSTVQHQHLFLKIKKPNIIDQEKIKQQKVIKKKQQKQIVQLATRIVNQVIKQNKNQKNKNIDNTQIKAKQKQKVIKKKEQSKQSKQKKTLIKKQQKKIIEDQKQQKKLLKKVQKEQQLKKKLQNNKKLKADRRCQKMSKVFQKSKKQFIQFVDKTMDLQMNNAISLYAQQNNINLNQKIILKQQKMIKRLGQYFDNDGQNYRGFVSKYQSVPFHDLLRLMKEQGVEDYTQEKYKQKRAKVMRNQSVKIQTPLISWNQSEQNSQWIEFPSSQSAKNNQSKGKILLKMKQLFGDQDSKLYFTFIEKYFELGQAQIISKWKEENATKTPNL